MRYLILPNALKPNAMNIQRRVWEMSKPEKGEDATLYYAGTVTHPTSGDVALIMTGETILLHPANIPDRLIEYLQTVLTIQQQTQAKNWVINHRGEAVDVLGMLGDTFFPTRVKTEEQMQALGWF